MKSCLVVVRPLSKPYWNLLPGVLCPQVCPNSNTLMCHTAVMHKVHPQPSTRRQPNLYSETARTTGNTKSVPGGLSLAMCKQGKNYHCDSHHSRANKDCWGPWDSLAFLPHHEEDIRKTQYYQDESKDLGQRQKTHTGMNWNAGTINQTE